jgi:hypothetical protein
MANYVTSAKKGVNWRSRDYGEVAQRLSCDSGEVAEMMSRGYRASTKGKCRTSEELAEQAAKRLYMRRTNNEVAEVLDRTVHAARN